MGMSITEALRVQAIERQVAELPELKARITALESSIARGPARRTRAAAIPEPLREINARRQTRCNVLRAAIAKVLARASRPEAIRAKDVAQAIARAGFEPMPRDRTLRLRLAEVRAEMATHGNTWNCQKTV